MAARRSARQLDHLFTKDLKRDIGLSFRVMSFRRPLRMDWAVSDEDWSIWAMHTQAFAR